ncbi:MAG TPA: hypothetical protein VFT84_14135 [Gemmatimonadales bacterium]|nr:hypothetical protein [Gemmatimonadales bacterium]
MDRLLTAMGIFIEYPLAAAGIGIALLVFGRRRGHRTVFGAGLAWLAYAVYEVGMQRRWLCSGECNIRLDLFIIYPILLLGLLAAALSLLRRPGSPRPPR